MTKQKNYALKSSAKYIFLCERPMKSSVWRDIFGVSVIMYIPNMFHPERSMKGFLSTECKFLIGKKMLSRNLKRSSVGSAEKSLF